ncbi:hypothetical protein [Nocardia sp. NPDC056100]|uniref:hypothetical protein n=1 Tax=Nocardia sp. NPDC056100 TaxID=3345712 RepID=UPI0035DD537D
MRDYREMCELFDTNHLGEPPIPARFRSPLRKVADWTYATRDIDPLRMYMFGDYRFEAERERVEDYVAVSRAGADTDPSYAITTYQLTLGSLALFAQVGCGGVDRDRAVDVAKVRRMFNACAMLADIAEVVPACPRHQLILTYCDFRESRLRWHTRLDEPACTTAPNDLERERTRRPGADPLPLFAAAARALEAHAGSTAREPE